MTPENQSFGLNFNRFLWMEGGINMECFRICTHNEKKSKMGWQVLVTVLSRRVPTNSNFPDFVFFSIDISLEEGWFILASIGRSRAKEKRFKSGHRLLKASNHKHFWRRRKKKRSPCITSRMPSALHLGFDPSTQS